MSRDSQSDSSRGQGQAANRESYMRDTPEPIRTLWDEKKAELAKGSYGVGATRGASDIPEQER